ncbi:probable leucine--tRNA ligase, mitochondrial [Nilaparvata lugens]|uniref:probable leucine--tRNA ligase, mitochondrial n=1 Tax=Nilaparvata lugens TaxID=108931 RepID=UPI00193EAB9E|nr:probable leucine--tRNA ligase, mitochondrial [Nilaparvata lugens]
MTCCNLSKKLHLIKQSTFSFSILRTFCSRSLGLWNHDLDESIKKKIEEHWKHKLKRFCYDPNDENREKCYVLSMFPYPSGKLHIGHVRVYTISDSIARFHRMQGKNVFHPMGWDAFGLPAENAAIERGVSAESWTRENIKTMRDQLMDLECSFDWDRELATCHPGYYKFTQDIFLRMYHSGLVHQKESLVNWDPVDKTVLADEQVDENGISWRSGAKVEKKPLRQWFIRSTKFAKSLYDGLDSPILENWRDITKIQKHWIGECNGTVIDFPISSTEGDDTLSVWTDKAEHISRAKFIVLAPGSLLDRKYPGELNRKLDIEAVNPFNGEKLPIYVAGKLDEEDTNEQPECKLGIPDASASDRDYARLFGLPVDEASPLLADDLEARDSICARAAAEGFGGHLVSANLRDWLISRQRHWGTPIPIIHCGQCGHQPVPFDQLPVLLPVDREPARIKEWAAAKCPKLAGIPDASASDRDYARLFGLPVDEASPLLADDLEARDSICARAVAEGFGGHLVSANLRDWLISRQRHWGTPIPIIHCGQCGHQPVPFDQLPVLLPVDREPARIKEWAAAKCPKCGSDATRETDTMDTFVDSSWYYLRYTDPRNQEMAFDKEKANKLAPVDIYVGGKEHAALHLYYARFVSHFLHSIGWLKEKEPFKRMLVQGIVMGKTFRVKGTGRFITEEEVEKVGKKLVEKGTGAAVVQTWEKMSKSKHNGVDPKQMLNDYGVDSTRLLTLADVSPTSNRNWNSQSKTLVEKGTGAAVVQTWEKMSKSKHNGVDPKQMLNDYGVDSTRLLTLADVSPTSNRNWNSQTFPGVLKWQHRLWLTVRQFQAARNIRDELQKSDTFDEQDAFIWDSRNFYLKGATFCYSYTHQLSVAISKMQGLTGSLRKSSKDVVALSGEYERALAAQIVMLAPIAPHFASELWSGFSEAPGRIDKNPGEIKWDCPLVEQSWPQTDELYKLDLKFMVNNAYKGSLKVARCELDALSKSSVEAMALNEPAVTSSIDNRPIIDVKYKLFPGCEAIINFITLKSDKKTEDSGDDECLAQKA